MVAEESVPFQILYEQRSCYAFKSRAASYILWKQKKEKW